MSISVADNFKYQGTKPLDDRIKYATVADMKAVADAKLYDGCEAYCAETDKYYKFKSTNTVDETTGKWRERESGGTSDYPDLTNKPSINNVTLSGNKTTSDLGLQAEMQLSTMPTAGVSYLGKTVQYVGATGNGYTHNYFYECVSDGEATPTYSWQQTNVQSSSGGGGGHTIEDSEGTDLTQRDTLQFGEGFLAEDDDTNEKTVISPDVMQSGDMDDVINYLPSIKPQYHHYSENVQFVGEYLGDKEVYEKTFSFTSVNVSANTWVTIADLSGLNAKKLVTASILSSNSTSSLIKAYVQISSNTLQIFSTQATTCDGAIIRFTTENSTNYTTTERIIATWIDNKPVYEKVFLFNATTPSANSWVTITSVEGLNIKKLIDVSILGNQNTSSLLTGDVRIYNNNLQVYLSHSMGCDGVIVQYTKTTD